MPERADDTAAKRTVQGLLRRCGERVCALVEPGKQRGEIARETDAAAAASLFIGSVQGLVLSSLNGGRASRLRAGAPGAFAIYRCGIGSRS